MMNDFKGKVLCFGELLLRLAPDHGGDWLVNQRLPTFVGGAELNVAGALTLWGQPCRYFTVLPENNLSFEIVRYLGKRDLDMSKVMYQGKRMGAYFLTKGMDMQHDALIYDRDNSAFAGLKHGMINYSSLLEGITWFHFSAICPAISGDIADICLELLKEATARGIFTSIDLNYRPKLWQYGKQPEEIMPGLVAYCDLIMGNIWSSSKMLGLSMFDPVPIGKSALIAEAKNITEQILRFNPRCKAVANTFRFGDQESLLYYSILNINGSFYVSKEFNGPGTIDMVGSGDCYMAGLIYSYYHNFTPEKMVDFATAAAFSKLYVNSDATDKSVEEVLKIVNDGELKDC